jgi:hypothetical protein
MLIVLSERRTAELIRELENIPDASLAEITHMIQRYAGRLFQHVAGFGVKMVVSCRTVLT